MKNDAKSDSKGDEVCVPVLGGGKGERPLVENKDSKDNM
jgi:hypothetical protein